jgi:glycosyltransferase involved in cell wall biosynthesis
MADIHILALDATRQGGAGVYTARFAKELAQRGHSVTLICHEANDELKNLITVHEIARTVSGRPFGLWRFSSFLQLGSYRNMMKKLKLSKPQIVFGSAQPIVWSYYKLYPGRPLIYLPHSLVAPIELQSYGYANRIQQKIAVMTYHFLEKWCLRKAAVTIRFSETACNAFKKHYGSKVCGRLTVIPMAIDIPCHQAKTHNNKIFRLLSVGRLIKSKNLMYLLETLSTMRDLNWHLDLVGSGDEKSSLEISTKRVGISEKVSFHGHTDNVEPFYRNADLFVFPSILENLPLVLLEAMSYSLPTLSFRPNGKTVITATNEVISHKGNGFMADNSEMFAFMLREIIEKKFNLDFVGAEAFKTINDFHRWDAHLDQVENIIDSTATE